MKQPLSIFIICKNEERIINRCLMQANQIADEIIIVDSGSTDKTLDIARRYTSKIYQQEWLGYAEQKNYALNLCSNKWVLSLDADEVLSDKLIAEIKNCDFKAPAYQIARKLFIGDKFIRWGGYYPDLQLRLFQKAQGKFCQESVHESVVINEVEKGSCPAFKAALDHYSYEDLEAMEKAYIKFAALANRKPNIVYAVFNYAYTFVNKFFFRLGFLQGLLGFKLALLHSKYSFRKYS